MPIDIQKRDIEPWRRRLYLPTYQVVDAARYARTSSQNVSNWHYRGSSSGPVLSGKERGKALSYLQLIEVAVIAVFRSYGVPMKNIRRTREYLAQQFQAEFPFVEYRFKTDGYHMMLDLQEFEPDIAIKELIVADKAGQLGWERMMEDRLIEFDYDGLNIVSKWHVAGRQSPVIIDPRVAFGAPMIKGVPTWVLKGRYEAGEEVEDIKDDFDLNSAEILEGLKFEKVELVS